ncbi:MAG: extracellular solute-binding protein [Nocardioides alkalitolerans]
MTRPSSRPRAAAVAGSLLVALSLLSACGGEGGGGRPIEGSDELKALAEAAQDEGQVVLYTSLTSTTTDKLAAAFQDTYGIRLVVSPVASQAAGQQKLEQEIDAGNVQGDVFLNTLDVAWAEEMGASGGLVDVTDLPDIDSLDEEFRSTYYVAPVLDLAGMAYNPTVLDEDDLPDTPEEFLASDDLRGRTVVLDPEIGGSSVNVHDVLFDQLGEQGYDAFVADLFDELDADMTTDFGVALTQVSSGEKAAFWPIPSRGVAPLKASGAPIAMHYFEPVPAVSSAVSVTADGPHPSAGKLLANWLMSEEAAEILCADEAMARPGLDVEGALELPDGVAFADPAEAATVYEEHVLPAFAQHAG